MAQITLNTKLTSEAFTVNDNDIIYLTPHYNESGSVDGANLTIIDTASVDIETKVIEETVAAVALLTTALVQVTLSDGSTPYINIGRIKDMVTNSSNYADIRYDANGNTFQNLSTSMTVAQVLAAIATDSRSLKTYLAVISQSGTSAPTVDFPGIDELTDSPTFYYDNVGLFRVGSDDFGDYADGKVFALLSATGNQGTAARSVDCYPTTAPISRDPLTSKCEIAIEAYNNATPTNGIIYLCTLIIYVKA